MWESTVIRCSLKNRQTMGAISRETVFVMGAGASVAEAIAHRPKRDRDHPPLDATFFQRAPRHALPTLLRRVEGHAEELGQLHLTDAVPPVSLEQHLGRLYFEMQRRPTDDNVGAYYDLINLYSDELLETTSWMAGRSGPIRRVIETELRRSDALSVVTFNHDLLIENALSLMAPSRFGRVWCMNHAYGLGSLETIANAGPTFSMECPGGPDEHVRIYKLHGSVNWVFRTLREHPPPEATRGKRDLLIWNKTSIPAYNRRVTYPGRSRGRRSWYLVTDRPSDL
jgi:hypothetical protein